MIDSITISLIIELLKFRVKLRLPVWRHCEANILNHRSLHWHEKSLTYMRISTECCNLLPRTFIKWSTLANNWVFIDNLQYNLSPALATNLWANSLWNIRTAHLKINNIFISDAILLATIHAKFINPVQVVYKCLLYECVLYLKNGLWSRSLKTNGDEILKI